MNRQPLFVLLVLMALSSSCGQVPPPVRSTDTPYIPVTTIANPIDPTDVIPSRVPPAGDDDATVTPTEFIPPAISPTATDYIPPTITPTPYVPTVAPAGGLTVTPTEFVPFVAPPTQERPNAESAIDQKYLDLGGETGFLGAPVGPELPTPDGIGFFRHFEGGSIYWTKDTGAWEVHGLIREKWASLGWETGFLGYPLTDESTTPDGIGRYNHFQGGSIYWTPNTGAWEVHGEIRNKWASLGWENGCLGYPISDEEPSKGGWSRQSRFEHGVIRWSPAQGAVETCY